MNFHFWQTSPNEHESGWIRGLTNMGHSVRVYICGDMPQSRMSLGLGQVDYGVAEIIRPSLVHMEECLQSCSTAEDLHFFTGIKEFQLNRMAYSLLSRSQARLFYISESKDIRGFKGVMRLLRDIVLDYYRRRRIDAVLAMGELGTKWFRRIGFDSSRIFEFCYAVADSSSHNRDIAPDHDPGRDANSFKVAYVGQLIKRKNVDSLLMALASINNEGLSFTLEIIGSGEEEVHLRQNASSLGIASVVNFLGAMKNDELRAHMRESDLLVLPSAWDGWGAVTNEALLAGCRVGVSLMCGSSVLAKNMPKCFTFPSGDVHTLASELRKQIAYGRVTQEERATKCVLARSMIGEVAIAKYLLHIVDFVIAPANNRPVQPWELPTTQFNHRKL